MSCPDPYRRRAGRPATCAPMLRSARQTHRVGAVLARTSDLAGEPAPQMALTRLSAEADAHNRVARNSHRLAERRSRPVRVHDQIAIGLLPLLQSGAPDRQFHALPEAS